MWADFKGIAAWYWLAVRWEARDMWRALPGPWWVKVIILVITQAIPGPQDEILLFAVLAILRARKARKARAATI